MYSMSKYNFSLSVSEKANVHEYVYDLISDLQIFLNRNLT